MDRRRVTLIAGLALSLAGVVALSVSLLGGVGHSSTQTTGGSGSTNTQQFFGIAQGISRFDDQDLETMTATGIGSDRFLLDWALVEPKQGTFQWPDKDIGALAAHGITMVPYLWGSPTWVADTPSNPPTGSVAEGEWEDFLKAAVARYGPGGSYWSGDYLKQFGADAKPLPIRSWQIWNEPNLEKYFAPKPSSEQYAHLLQISHDAIKSQDPKAEIVLAGMPGFGKPKAWDFLDSLYGVPGFKDNFDVAALHPYAPTLMELSSEVRKFRAAMTSNGDASKPLWLTELAWGSAAPDRFNLNKGIPGQAQLLENSFKLIELNRRNWNLQRVFWFDWRDPIPGSVVAKACSFCGSAGLLMYDRTPKPSYQAFKSFTAGD
jgi:polysaccharide biosynthesis protein PslG